MTKLENLRMQCPDLDWDQTCQTCIRDQTCNPSVPIRTKLASGCRPEKSIFGRTCYSHPSYISSVITWFASGKSVFASSALKNVTSFSFDLHSVYGTTIKCTLLRSTFDRLRPIASRPPKIPKIQYEIGSICEMTRNPPPPNPRFRQGKTT